MKRPIHKIVHEIQKYIFKSFIFLCLFLIHQILNVPCTYILLSCVSFIFYVYLIEDYSPTLMFAEFHSNSFFDFIYIFSRMIELIVIVFKISISPKNGWLIPFVIINHHYHKIPLNYFKITKSRKMFWFFYFLDFALIKTVWHSQK